MIKNKNGNLVITLIWIKVIIIIAIFLIEIFSIFYSLYSIERNATIAMECALKEIYVDANNVVLINQTDATNTFYNYFQKNLKLNASLQPLPGNNQIYGQVELLEIFTYDANTSGLPYLEVATGKTFDYPTMHIRFRARIRSLSSAYLGTNISIPVNIHIDESNEPLQ
jgi:hypothetical protein